MIDQVRRVTVSALWIPLTAAVSAGGGIASMAWMASSLKTEIVMSIKAEHERNVEQDTVIREIQQRTQNLETEQKLTRAELDRQKDDIRSQIRRIQ